MNKIYSFLRGLLWMPFKILYPTKIVNIDNMPSHNRLITVTNHLSWIDIPVLAINIKGYRHFLAKKEIGNNKFLNKVALDLGVIFIDRGNSDMSAIRNCVSSLKRQEGLSIFPEGTRNKSGEEMGDIKAGVCMLAIKGGAEIVPILLYRKPKIFKRNYLMIGQPFNLDEFKGQLLSTDILEQASQIVENNMKITRTELIEFVEGKRWKQIKSKNKKDKKEFVKYSKIVLKESSTLTKSLIKKKISTAVK